MIEKTKGIVLHQIKYSDSGIIVQLYTSIFGRQSLLVKGLRKKKSGRHNILFQPLRIIHLKIPLFIGVNKVGIQEPDLIQKPD